MVIQLEGCSVVNGDFGDRENWFGFEFWGKEQVRRRRHGKKGDSGFGCR